MNEIIEKKRQWLHRIAFGCMDLFLPRRCPVCGLRLAVWQEERICRRCAAAIEYLQPPVCRRCGTEVAVAADSDHIPLCGVCLRQDPPYLLARSMVRYTAQIRQLMHGFKYRGDMSVLPGLVELIEQYDMAEFAGLDRITVVPLHVDRLRQRGFNQALVLARLFFAGHRRLIDPDLLLRSRNTVPQTELVGKDRRKNLQGIFQLRRNVDLTGMRVGLVDDVFTTGTTVSECSRVLMQHGAAEVRILTLARAVLFRYDRKRLG